MERDDFLVQRRTYQAEQPEKYQHEQHEQDEQEEAAAANKRVLFLELCELHYNISYAQPENIEDIDSWNNEIGTVCSEGKILQTLQASLDKCLQRTNIQALLQNDNEEKYSEFVSQFKTIKSDIASLTTDINNYPHDDDNYVIRHVAYLVICEKTDNLIKLLYHESLKLTKPNTTSQANHGTTSGITLNTLALLNKDIFQIAANFLPPSSISSWRRTSSCFQKILGNVWCQIIEKKERIVRVYSPDGASILITGAGDVYGFGSELNKYVPPLNPPTLNPSQLSKITNFISSNALELGVSYECDKHWALTQIKGLKNVAQLALTRKLGITYILNHTGELSFVTVSGSKGAGDRLIHHTAKYIEIRKHITQIAASGSYHLLACDINGNLLQHGSYTDSPNLISLSNNLIPTDIRVAQLALNRIPRNTNSYIYLLVLNKETGHVFWSTSNGSWSAHTNHVQRIDHLSNIIKIVVSSSSDHYGYPMPEETWQLALNKNGEVWSWGDNTLGQLGHRENIEERQNYFKAENTTIMNAGISSPKPKHFTSPNPTKIDGLTDVKDIFATPHASFFAMAKGLLWCGNNGRTVERWSMRSTYQYELTSTPTPIPIFKNRRITQVSGNYHCTLFLDASGEVFVYGSNAAITRTLTPTCPFSTSNLPDYYTTPTRLTLAGSPLRFEEKMTLPTLFKLARNTANNHNNPAHNHKNPARYLIEIIKQYKMQDAATATKNIDKLVLASALLYSYDDVEAMHYISAYSDPMQTHIMCINKMLEQLNQKNEMDYDTRRKTIKWFQKLVGCYNAHNRSTDNNKQTQFTNLLKTIVNLSENCDHSDSRAKLVQFLKGEPSKIERAGTILKQLDEANPCFLATLAQAVLLDIKRSSAQENAVQSTPEIMLTQIATTFDEVTSTVSRFFS